jgi:hypothetical protein
MFLFDRLEKYILYLSFTTVIQLDVSLISGLDTIKLQVKDDRGLESV